MSRPRQGPCRKLVLIGAVPPIMLKTAANPGGLPIEIFDGLRQQFAANSAQFYWNLRAVPSTVRNGWPSIDTTISATRAARPASGLRNSQRLTMSSRMPGPP